MVLTTENILLIGSILLFLSLLAGKTSSRFGVPVLILFLAIGMLAGSEGLGGIHFDNPKTAQFIGIISLNFILFSGGLDTDYKAIKPIIGAGITLSTLGVILTTAFVGLFVYLITDFCLTEGLLLGAIVSSTDSAAVFSILRSKGLALKRNIRPVLELESGSNDPMAYVLTLVLTDLVVNPQLSVWIAIPVLIKQFIIGAALGFACGKAATLIINRIKLDYEGLYVVLGIAIMFFSFAFTDFVGGNGFLAVYIAAVYIGNQELIHKKKYIKSFDSFAWLMQIVLFVTLGLLVFPSEIVPFIGIGLLISLFLMLIARPVSVFISFLPFHILKRDKLFISWVGLRGAVPIVFATFPLIAGVEKAHMIFNVVFFISLSSVILQGTTLSLIAKWLHLSLPVQLKKRTQTDLELEESIKSVFKVILIPHQSNIIGKKIVELKFPKTARISIIKRDNNFLTPNGSTVLLENDKLFIISENMNDLNNIFTCLDIHQNILDAAINE
jgi:cell volume regulation protein A